MVLRRRVSGNFGEEVGRVGKRGGKGAGGGGGGGGRGRRRTEARC